MQLTYTGPDTGNVATLVRSTDSSVPTPSPDDKAAGFTIQVIKVSCQPGGSGKLTFSLQIFRAPSGIEAVPLAFPASDLAGESAGVPSIAFGSTSDFRWYVSTCPDAIYVWRFYGKLRIVLAGTYTLCTTSDDGSLLYMDMVAGRVGNPVYNLLIDNDGVHGDHQVESHASYSNRRLLA
jgi:hypothetical protein